MQIVNKLASERFAFRNFSALLFLEAIGYSGNRFYDVCFGAFSVSRKVLDMSFSDIYAPALPYHSRISDRKV